MSKTVQPLERPSIVEVEWLDSMSHTSWQKRETLMADLNEPRCLHHWTSGYLLSRTAQHTVVAQSFGDKTKQISNVLQIPSKSVVSVTVIREKSRATGRTGKK